MNSNDTPKIVWVYVYLWGKGTRFHYILTGADDDHHHHHQTFDPIFKVRYKTDAHETRRRPFFII